MDLATYRQEKGLSQAALAALLTATGSPATQGLVSQWENGTVLIPPERWAFIERVTDGYVTHRDLRPDLFPPAKGQEVADAA
ncbi:YdaS family helix-turn-helix protein [Stenotrophomonas sp. HITSZ_GD]|uniref:transcriptional regulator n=1 Tax=Stenotrophomonas sp. HITSZ_GD TaxID=3037248 RepID=UPI00240D5513|nr:YdaS family helix-turn-helix protein [Stenotrophomonas sp. HITSZ_GD]MDG2524620.1 YdaS family helix-turn-helix protein [Stenotrophomonas sp. HITSZ_GD]